MTRAAKFLAFLILAVAANGVRAADKLVVADAWIREAPADAPMLAGYCRITNPGILPMTVVGTKGRLFARAEIHETREENGLSIMRKVEKLTIAAGGTVDLAPGGMHLMLMQPRYPLKKGDRADIVFLLADGAEVKASFEVRREIPAH